MSRVIEIEINGPRNESAYFLPAKRTIRGRFEWQKLSDPMAMSKTDEWGYYFPGQVLGLDMDTGAGYIREPLHEEAHLEARRRVEKHQLALPPALEKIPNVHVATWVHWMKRLVADGIARVVSGVLPDKVEGVPQTQFFHRYKPDQTTGAAAQTEQIKQQADTIDQLKALAAQQQQQIADLMKVLVDGARPPQGNPQQQQQSKR